MEIGQNDPKLFWNTIKKMNNWGKAQTDDPTDDITPDKWMDYFQKLLNVKNTPRYDTNGYFKSFEPMVLIVHTTAQLMRWSKP